MHRPSFSLRIIPVGQIVSSIVIGMPYYLNILN